MFKKFLAILALLFASAAMAAVVDVNKATEAELDGVKGIGPGTSKLILEERKKAPFKNWEDFISRVKGVGESRAANLSEAGLRVGGRMYKPAADDKAAAKDAKKDEKTAAKDTKAAAKDEKKDAKAVAAAPAASSAKAAASAKK